MWVALISPSMVMYSSTSITESSVMLVEGVGVADSHSGGHHQGAAVWLWSGRFDWNRNEASRGISEV